MSVSTEPTSPQDPLHYAPRRWRERLEQKLTTVDDTRRGLDSNRLDTAIGRSSPSAPVDPQLENAVHESLRRPIRAATIGKPSAMTPELERRKAMYSLAGRVAAAIGASAIIAMFFVIMMPASRQSDEPAVAAASAASSNATSTSPTVKSFASALAQQPPQSDEPSKPALAEFESLLKPTDTAQATPPEQPAKQPSDEAIQQFLQWRQKTAAAPQ